MQSTIGYASVCYCRFKHNGKYFVRFLFGKSKVCPSKMKLTVPKLEFVAACMSVRIAEAIKK